MRRYDIMKTSSYFAISYIRLKTFNWIIKVKRYVTKLMNVIIM